MAGRKCLDVACNDCRRLLTGLALALLSLLMPSSAFGSTNVSGPIACTPPATTCVVNWTLAGSPYWSVGGVRVDPGVTLDISPGVVVKEGTIEVWGSVNAIGTSTQPITFTSVQDDAVDGLDLGGDGPTVGSSGQWVGFYFGKADGAAHFAYSTIRYAGNAIDLVQKQVTIADSQIYQNVNGIFVDATPGCAAVCSSRIGSR